MDLLLILFLTLAIVVFTLPVGLVCREMSFKNFLMIILITVALVFITSQSSQTEDYMQLINFIIGVVLIITGFLTHQKNSVLILPVYIITLALSVIVLNIDLKGFSLLYPIILTVILLLFSYRLADCLEVVSLAHYSLLLGLYFILSALIVPSIVSALSKTFSPIILLNTDSFIYLLFFVIVFVFIGFYLNKFYGGRKL